MIAVMCQLVLKISEPIRYDKSAACKVECYSVECGIILSYA